MSTATTPPATTVGESPTAAASPPASDTTAAASLSRAEGRKVVLATFIGTTVEWYDFYLYASCTALIFGPQFFPSDDPAVAQIAAFATFALGSVAKPFGGLIAGHFGDRLGRKGMLVLSLFVMGIATALIAVLPTYAQIGVAAPAILTVLRLIQGIGVGAEWGGALTMAVESAPQHRKALYSVAPVLGLPAGLLLSNVVLIALGALTGPAFTAWGWRIAFALSLALVFIGLWTRRTMPESPVFEKTVEQGERRSLPLFDVIRRYPVPLLLTMIIAAVPGIPATLVLTWSLNYGTTEIGYGRNALLGIVALSCAIQLLALPWLASLADRHNPRRLAVIGALTMIAACLVFFPLFTSGHVWLAGLGTILVHASTFLPLVLIPPILTRAFPGAVRYTGVSLAYQLGGVFGGGLVPVIAASLLTSTGSTTPITLYMVISCAALALSAIALGVHYRIHRNEPDWD